jgi:hypothetical protein
MSLLFLVEARKHFDPIAQQFSLSCTACSEWKLRYENEVVFLEVNFDNARSYEVAVELGKKDSRLPERPFTLAEVLRLRGVEGTSFVDGLQASDQARLAQALARLADLVSRYAIDFLSGNSFSFAQLAKLREREGLAYALARDLRLARIDAEIAWAAKDYKKVVKAYEPLELYLTSAEKKRLEYSRKQLSP